MGETAEIVTLSLTVDKRLLGGCVGGTEKMMSKNLISEHLHEMYLRIECHHHLGPATK